MEPGSLAGQGNILAGEPATDEVNGLKDASPNISDISVARDIWPVSGQDFVRIVIEFYLPPYLDPGPFEPQIETANAGEE